MHSRNGLNQCTASLSQLGKIKHGSVDFSIKGVNRQSAELFLSHRQTSNICKNRKAAIPTLLLNVPAMTETLLDKR